MLRLFYGKALNSVGINTFMKCAFCFRPAKSRNSNVQHELRCKLNPYHLSLRYLSESGPKRQGIIDPTPCDFCGKVHTTKSSLNNHKIRCPQNPNRQIQKMSDAGKQRSKIANQEKVKRIWNDPAFRERHKQSMKRAVENNPESYTSSNRGRTKQIEYDGIKFQGQWELDFYKWARNQGLAPKRPNTGFPYEWNGQRTYFPDFYIDQIDAYIEVKGYETERDQAKWSQFPKRLIIIKEKQIKEIRSGIFKGIDLR